MVKIVYGSESEPFLAQADTLPECIEKVQIQLEKILVNEIELNQKEITLLLIEKSMGNWNQEMHFLVEELKDLNYELESTIDVIKKSKTIASLSSLNLLADDWMVRRLS